MKKIKMKDTILSHYQKVHELEMDGFAVRVFKPYTMQQLPSFQMLEWMKHRAHEAIRYMIMEQKAEWGMGNPDYGMWDAQVVYHYDPRGKAFNIYIAAILVRPFSREAYETYQNFDAAYIDDVNQRLMLMWDSREYDRIGGYDTSYGAYKNQKEADAQMYHVTDKKRDIADESPDFYHEGESEQHPGMTLKYKMEDDKVCTAVSWPRHDPALVTDLPTHAEVCTEEFLKFTEAHPEFKEMHFFTEPSYWGEDEEK